jgi:hypothetical protein
MKKQWILIGILVAVLAIAGTIFGLNRGAGETVQGALSNQAANNTITSVPYWDEVQSTYISPEGWPHELYMTQSSTPETSVPYWDEVQSTAISPEGWPYELFILRLATPER